MSKRTRWAHMVATYETLATGEVVTELSTSLPEGHVASPSCPCRPRKPHRRMGYIHSSEPIR